MVGKFSAIFTVPVLDICVTGACNLDCPYCFGEVDKKPGMPQAIFIQALSFAHCIGARALEFCGGEPLLYRDFCWAARRARAEGFELILRTNGFLVSNHRNFIAENFSAVGISLDGDTERNDLMRPLKGRSGMSAQSKFEIPFTEIFMLKALNSELRVILASVATAINYTGIYELAQILLQRNPPLDLWKVYQFVANNFRAVENRDRFMLSSEAFASLQRDIRTIVGDEFPVAFRKSEVVDGSCLVLNRDGEVLVGSRTFGNVMDDDCVGISRRLRAAGAALAVSSNKISTYHNLSQEGPR